MGEREGLARVMHDTYERARTPEGWLSIADAVLASDWLAAHVARATADAEARLAAVEDLADDLCDFNPGHGDFLTAGKSLRAALNPAPTTDAEACPVATLPGHPCHEDATGCPRLGMCRALMREHPAPPTGADSSPANHPITARGGPLETAGAPGQASPDPDGRAGAGEGGPPTTDADGRDERRDGVGGTRWERG